MPRTRAGALWAVALGALVAGVAAYAVAVRIVPTAAVPPAAQTTQDVAPRDAPAPVPAPTLTPSPHPVADVVTPAVAPTRMTGSIAGCALPVRVRFVDAATGAEVPGGTANLLGTSRDGFMSVEVDASPPEGWIADAQTARVSHAPLAPGASSLALDVPVRREQPLEVTVPAGVDVRPGDDAWFRSGRSWPARLEATDRAGVLRVRGAAALLGEESVVDVFALSGAWRAAGPPSSPGGPLVLGRYPDPRPYASCWGVSCTTARRWGRDDRFADPRLDPACASRVTVRVRPAAGEPGRVALHVAAFDAVRMANSYRARGLVSVEGMTGEDGVAVVDHLPAGELWIEACAPGFALTRKVVDLAADGALDVEIVESQRPAAELLVVDEATGAGVGGAAVTFDSVAPWALVEDGVQRLNLLSGPDGRVRLPGLGDDWPEVTVSYGSRTKSVHVQAGESATVSLPPGEPPK